MQLAAVAALDVGEHADGVLGIGRSEHDAVAVVGLGQQIAAVAEQAFAVGRALGTRVVGLRLEQVAAIVGHVQQLAGDHDLAEAGERRSADVVHLEAGIQGGQRGAYGLVGRSVGGRGGLGRSRGGCLGGRRSRLGASGQAERTEHGGDGKSEHGAVRDRRRPRILTQPPLPGRDTAHRPRPGFRPLLSRADGGARAASAGVRGPPGCRSGWSTASCGRAASAARAGRRRG